MASCYEVEVKITSARGLKNVNWRHGANKPYAVVWVDPKNKCSTKVDEDGDIEAKWDQTLQIPLPVGPIEDFTLYIDIVNAGLEDDSHDTKPLIGSARLKLADVTNDVGFDDRASRTLRLKRPSGRPQGTVEVKVSVKDKTYPAPGGYYAPPYGVPPPAGQSCDFSAAPPAYGNVYGGAYNAPPSGYPYSVAPPLGYPYGGGGYGAPPQAASYGKESYVSNMTPQAAAPLEMGSYGQGSYGSNVPSQTAASVEEKKKSKFGGMGTGLAVGALAGAVGGIALIGGASYVENKIADKVVDKVEDDLGYDNDDYY